VVISAPPEPKTGAVTIWPSTGMPSWSALVKKSSTMLGTPAGVNFGFSPRRPSGTAESVSRVASLTS
jgi:hypothetical protein